MLSRKSQVDIDFIFGYIVFIGFMLYMINFIFSMTGPFKDAVDFSIQERRAYLLMEELSLGRNSIDDFSKICNKSYDFLSSYYAEYVLLGFKTPYYDTAPDGEYELLMQRTGNSIKISAKKPCTLQFVIPDESSASVSRINFGLYDNITEKRDFFNNMVVTMEINADSNNEKNAVITLAKESFISFSAENIELDRAFIGRTRIKSSCGKKSASQNHFYVEDLIAVSDKNDKFPAALKVDAWWIS